MGLLDIKKSVTQRLGLEPIQTEEGFQFGGATPCYLEKVFVDSQKYEKGEFAGLEVPVLRFEFINYKFNKTDVDKFLTHSEKPVGGKMLVSGTEDQYEAVPTEKIEKFIGEQWARIKCIIQTFKGCVNYKEIENISDADVKKYFNLPAVATPEAKINAYLNFYTYIANFFNNEGKSFNLDKDANLIPIWLRIEPDYNSGKFYTIPAYVEKGITELMKRDATGKILNPQTIKIKVDLHLRIGKKNRSKGTVNPGSSPSEDDEIQDLINKSNQ